MNNKDKDNVKVDDKGRSYTTEAGFSYFVYDFIKQVRVATTNDIISYVRDNFDFLEGDIVKTSEKRAGLRYRQMVDNLIKSHGSILKLFHDLSDFYGGICLKGEVISENIKERVRFEMSTVAKKREAERLLKEEEERVLQLKTIELQKNMNGALKRAKELRPKILEIVKNKGVDVKEVSEYFNEIVIDVVHRHPELLDNDDDFIKAFCIEM